MSQAAWSSAVHDLPPLQRKVPPDEPPALPWQALAPAEPLPMMFRLELCSGRCVSYAYSDLREVRTIGAGRVELMILGMEKIRVSLTGRHLVDLAHAIAAGRIRSVTQTDPRDFSIGEGDPAIDQIDVETLTGPAA